MGPRFASQEEAERRVAELEAALALHVVQPGLENAEQAPGVGKCAPRRRRRRSRGPKFLGNDANGSGRWQCDWYPHGAQGPRKRRTIYGTREDAEKFLAERRAERRNRAAGFFTPAPLADAVRLYVETMKADHRKGHWRNVERTLARLVRELPGKTTAEDVTYGYLIDYRRRRQAESGEHTKRPVTAQTIKREMAEIRAFLEAEVQAGRLMDNPAARIKPLRCDAKPGRWLTPGEFATIYSMAPEHVRDAMDVLVGTGLRLGELLALKPGHVRGNALEVVERKARDFLHLRVGPALLAVLSPRLADLPWPGLKSLSCTLARLARKAGLPRLGAHAFRHSAATWLLAAGVDIYRIRYRLGHSSVTVTERYSKLREALDWKTDAASLPERTRRIFAEGVSIISPSFAPEGILRISGQEKPATQAEGAEGCNSAEEAELRQAVVS